MQRFAWLVCFPPVPYVAKFVDERHAFPIVYTGAPLSVGASPIYTPRAWIDHERDIDGMVCGYEQIDEDLGLLD